MPDFVPQRYGPDGSGPNGPWRSAARDYGTTRQQDYWTKKTSPSVLSSHRSLYISVPSRQRPCPPTHVKRILVIDDDAKLRLQCVELLRLEGYSVVEAPNGREGVEQARRELPDLIVCDVTMPEMNGHRVLETLRNEPRTSHVPFIFLTGWSEREDVRTGMNLGADDYLVKPVVPDDLLAAIRARLRRATTTTTRRPTSDPTPAQLEALGLTRREAEVLFWVARGKTNDEIAMVLGVGRTTVKKHLESTFAKLGVENRTTAAATALEHLGA